MALNFLKHVPVSTGSVRQAASTASRTTAPSIRRWPRSTTRSTANSSLFARYFYAVYDNPATYDGTNVLTLSRTSQNNQVHSLVLGHNQVLSASTLNSLHVTINKTLNDRPLPPYFSATDLGSKISSLVPRLRRRQRHRQRLLGRRRRARTRATSTRTACRSPTTSTSFAAHTSCRSAATGFTRGSRRSTTGRPTARSRSTGRAPGSRWPTS